MSDSYWAKRWYPSSLNFTQVADLTVCHMGSRLLDGIPGAVALDKDNRVARCSTPND
ncbi:hypothetical protein KSX_08000 [Ktedonospora formicarum]|uniref:Uncharacterized protein n=1 Tax=Ktedonospora formicarum TaxID=2778364 RepID=A0A8J3HXV6_9CHLR|nr:hypothetical protein KSX_08000 [Ktedonospora formicarum]